MAKSKNNGKSKLGQTVSARVTRQQAGPETLVPVPLGTIQMIDKFMEASTGPIGLARQITSSLQMSLDRAGVGRQAESAPQRQD
jgi:hypothetical protein